MIKILAVGVALLTGTATVAVSSASEPITLTPYKAAYKTKAMGMKLKIERELVATDEGYSLISKGSSMFAKIQESARFKLVGKQIQGIDYQYQLKSVVRRRREVIFLPETGVIRSLKKDEWTEHPWSETVLDQLSQQEQLRLDLKLAARDAEIPPASLEFQVVDGPRIKDRTLKFIGEETLKTPMGDVLTLHYKQVRSAEAKRRSSVWIAPSLDYMMVRTQHQEDDSVIEILLESVTIAAQ